MTSHPGANVLLVDDEPANLLALRAVLAEIGATLVCAGSGREALRLTQDTDFAAILLDVRMPEMDGFEVARLIRSRPRSRATPILFVTAGDSTDLASEEAYALGAVDFLTKPLRPAMLKAKVSFFIELYTRREELRGAERRAVNERAFLAAVLETIEDGIVACDRDGALTVFNRATRTLHGLPEEPLPPERWASHYGLYRADGKTTLPVAEIPLLRALRGENVRDAEMVVAPNGLEPRTLLASGQALYDSAGRKLGAVVSMHDVTARREADAARDTARREKERRRDAESAAQANAKFRAFFEQGSHFAALVALDGTVLEANRLMLESAGLARRDVVGRKFWECGWWGAGDAAETVRTASLQAAAGVPFQRELTYVTAAGQQRSVDLIIAPVTDEQGNVLFVAPSGIDTTERNRAAAALQALAEELAVSDRRKTEFLATLAHELRNPLAPLRSGLHVMQLASGDTAVLERTRAMMDRQVTHMVRLIDDLLDVARISSGKVELKKARVPLRTVVESAVETCLPLLEAGGHRLAVQVPDEPLVLEVDPTRLAQVLGNLLNNAAKYTPAGGDIGLVATARGKEVAIAVTDTGIGIPPEHLPHLFQIFTQVGRGMERAQGGLGIGLSLVRALVDLHGGSVTAQSAGAGQGSVFTVRLPLAPAEGGSAATIAPAPTAAAPAHRFRVLVVDDNRDAADSLAMILELNGHKIRVANDGDQAIGMAGEFKPQVVFLDIGMPGKNGYEVARELRRSEAASQAVLVALTGWGADDDRARSRDAGFDHHLTKPAEVSAVERLLAQLPRPAA